MHTSTGRLAYSGKYKLILTVDQGIQDYYYYLLPKYLDAKKQYHPAHISVVRKETPSVLSAWGKYEGDKLEFRYTSEIFFGNVYCWLNVFCVRLEEVRKELGLPVTSEFTRPPDGYSKCFHMTVANFKCTSGLVSR